LERRSSAGARRPRALARRGEAGRGVRGGAAGGAGRRRGVRGLVRRVGEAARSWSSASAPRSPRLVRAGDGALVRFDGVDDVLAASGLALAPGDFTLCVRATARSNAGGFPRLRRRQREPGATTTRAASRSTCQWAAVGAARRGERRRGGVRRRARPARGRGRLRELPHLHRALGAEADAIALFLDGTPQGWRDLAAPPPPLPLDELCVGARFYSNTSDVPCATGFLDGDVEELHPLRAPRSRRRSSRRFEGYLAAKWTPIERALLAAERLHRVALAPVKPAPVEFLAPGFSARALPVARSPT
jgi:hypothetical protein